MAKITKAQVLELLDEFAAVETRLLKLEAKRNEDLAPLAEAYAEACEPILKKFEKASGKLADKRASVVNQINSYLDAAGRDQVITGGRAYAERKSETKIGRRTIEPQKFFDTVAQKGKEFWACLRVEILRAEKFMGKTAIDEMSERQEETVVVRSVKLL